MRYSKDETNLLILNSILENKVYYVKYVDWCGSLSEMDRLCLCFLNSLMNLNEIWSEN